VLPLAACIVAGAVLYAPTLATLANTWTHDATYSHGWAIVPVAMALAWRQRRTETAEDHPSAVGLLVVVASLALFLVGSLGAELFTTRISLVGVIAGTILYVWGWQHLRTYAFPLSLVFFAIPLPAIVFDRLTLSLQLLATRLGEGLLQTTGIPVLRDGNLLTLSNVTLEVGDECSGIRSLMSLGAVAAVVGHLFTASWQQRAALAALVLPLAIGLNGLRIALTGLAAVELGPDAARGAIHAGSGYTVYLIAIAVLIACTRVMQPAEVA